MKKILISSLAGITLASTILFSFSPIVSAQKNLEPLSSQSVSLSQNLLANQDPEIVPMYVPIPYTYVYTKFIPNSSLKSLINKMGSSVNAVNLFSLFAGTTPVVGASIAFGGYFLSSTMSGRKTTYENAYNSGKGIQLIVRNNPNYNGYNSRQLLDVIATSTRMQ